MQRRPAVRDDFHWDDVRLFLTLCRSSTVGAAARALGVDASTVSRRLVLLEERLAGTLFDRGRDGIVPTQAAENLLPVAEEMEAVMTRFANAAQSFEREITGLVRIACPPDLAEVVLIPLMAEVQARHPRLRVELTPGEAVLDLTRREADLALRTARPVRGDLIVTRLRSVSWALVAAPRVARRLGTLRAWTDAPWIGWGERTSSIAPARWFSASTSGLEPVLRSDSLRIQIAAVQAEIGIALVPEPSVEHYGLVPVKLAARLRKQAQELPVDELFAVSHRALRDVPRVRVLWELLRERLGPG